MSFEIDAMTDAEVLAELTEHQRKFREEDFQRLEWRLKLRAACLGWTGDPLKQPPRSVLLEVRYLMALRNGDSA